MRYRDEQLMDKMDKYMDQVERVTMSLHECEEKLTGFEIQEEYHAADLRKEMTLLKKVLGDEKRRSTGDSQKISELQALFGSALKSYNEAIDQAKHLEHKTKKNNDEAVAEAAANRSHSP